MKNSYSLGLTNIFFEALKYPQFARPNFFINKQKQSEWSKGVYLTALDEVYHGSIAVLQMHFSSQKKNRRDIRIEDFKVSIKIFGIEDEQIIDKQILDELHYAIQYAWRFNTIEKSYSPYQILSFVEVALIFIKSEFNEQAREVGKPHTRPRARTYFNYLIAQDGPFFNFPIFKNTVRELLYSTPSVKKLEKLLKSFHKVAVEIVKLWNEKIYFIEQNTQAKDSSVQMERVRVEFHADTLQKSWWSDNKLFDNLPHEVFMNQDFASYAAKIANLINGEVIHASETQVKPITKDFLNDFIRGIEHISDLNDSHVAIRNVLQGIRHEAPFRDFFASWLEAQNYKANREPLRGENHIDLKIEHVSITKKIIEFKGWWNRDKYVIIQQLFNYLTQFDGEGYIFIINHSGKNIEDLYRENITNGQNGCTGEWKTISYKRTAFKYYLSKHKIEGQTKLVYHFILNIQRPKRIRRKDTSKVAKRR